MTKLISFHGDQAIKDKYLARVRAHAAADEIIKGTYWQGGKGCAVGCTVHSDSHDAYETEIGISWRLALVEDSLFERIPNAEAKLWPEQFLQALPVGVDTDLVFKKWTIWVLVDEKDGLINVIKNDKAKDLLKRIADLYTKSMTEEVPQEEWKKLQNEADYASASAYASTSAYASASASASAYASASTSASAYASAYASASAYAYAYAYAEWHQIFEKRIIQMRDKLIELLQSA